jgi:membrane protein
MALIKGKDVWPLLKQTGSDWVEDKAPKLAAALATYTMLSIAPLLVITTKIVSIYYRGGAKEKIAGALQDVLPGVGSKAIEAMIEQASKPGQGTVATVLSIIIAAYGATGVFAELQDSMNTIWEVKPKPQGIFGWLRARFFSFATVLGLAFLFMVSTVGSALVIGLGNKMSGGNAIVAGVLTHVVSLVIMTVLFGLIFKLLPDAEVQWRDVILGAVVTAVLFELGKIALAFYIKGSASLVFGAAGSLAALLLWVYYSAQILFFGAEFTQAYAKKYGSGIRPADYATRVTDEERAQQGMVTDQRLAAKTAQQEGKAPGGAVGRRPAAAQSWAGRQGVPSPSIPRYGMTPVGADDGNGHGNLRSLVVAGVGAAVGALAGALGATAMAKETKRPVRKHLAAVQLDQRLKNVEQRVGKISRIHQYLEDEAVYNRIKQVERRIRHARGVLRAEQNRRPNWLVRLGDAIAGNKN